MIVLLLFGAGRLPNVMGDFAKGIKAFKAGMRDEDKPEQPVTTASTISPATPAQPMPSNATHEQKAG